MRQEIILEQFKKSLIHLNDDLIIFIVELFIGVICRFEDDAFYINRYFIFKTFWPGRL